jgi:hypothetical protein
VCIHGVGTELMEQRERRKDMFELELEARARSESRSAAEYLAKIDCISIGWRFSFCG